MAPRKPPRTPRIATGFDKGYTCTNPDCESEDLDRDDDLDEHTWTCKACGESVLVEMSDEDGHTRYVRRCQAQHLEQDDFIYLDHELERAYRVKGSRKGEGKANGNKWQLGLENYTAIYVEPDRYINRV
ncbi:hypothetical protein BK661_10190 [Pseudomonas frederiksbergensis]|uniref:Uncharacterized protein n=1 Tax=Pseudomonas frederiksbergensis TaxID=104087 RepID=A0A423J9S1_9PSED|nr:hypothetical protein [Pseudomonas frederiksbergensis]RON34438.1 hypothetical protein BK661_10190 [Pseudomonas frederiksbergensis]